MDNAATHVRTVECDVCGKPWTGHFALDDKRDKATDKDCLAAQNAVKLQGYQRDAEEDADFKRWKREQQEGKRL